MKPNEKVRKGDKYNTVFGGVFADSFNWRDDGEQSAVCRPYIRRIAKKGGKRK